MGETGLQRRVLLLPGQPASGAQHRRPRWDQRREKLSERRRQCFSAVLRTRSKAAITARGESNVYRLAQVSVNIIDQCAAQGVPFAREYGGLLANRSFGGAQVSRTFYARGQTGQQLLLGAYQALEKQIAAGKVTMRPRTEMLELIVVDGRARGIVTRDLVSGEIKTHVADCVVLATGGYGNAFYLSTNAKGCNRDGDLARPPKRRFFGQPLFYARSTPPAFRSRASTRASSPS